MSPSKLTSEVWPVVDPGQVSAEREDSVLIYQPVDPTEVYHSGSLYIVASSLSSGERGQLASRYAAQKVMSTYFKRWKFNPIQQNYISYGKTWVKSSF